jgi:hypothetical protein
VLSNPTNQFRCLNFSYLNLLLCYDIHESPGSQFAIGGHDFDSQRIYSFTTLICKIDKQILRLNYTFKSSF